MDRDLTAIEIIPIAIAKEQEAESLYKRMSAMIKNPLVQEKFLSLSREEKKHEEILTRMYKKMTGGENVKEFLSKMSFSASEVINFDMTLDELFLLAIQREKDAQSMYKIAAEVSKDESGRRTFRYLVDFERGHEVLLLSEFDNYKRDKNWYAECPDVMLVGP